MSRPKHATFSRRNALALSFSTLALAAASCGLPAEGGEPEPVDQSAKEIINGTVVSAGDQTRNGLVSLRNIQTGGTCSGMLLNNEWILTAKHCTSHAGFSLVRATLAGTTEVVDRVSYVGPGDLAVMHLRAPFNINGSTTGFSQLMPGPAPAAGTTLTCFGQGVSAFNTDASGTRTGGVNGGGTYRTAQLSTVGNSNDRFGVLNINLQPNPNSQISAFGDSGGPCFQPGPFGFPVPAGIASTVNCVGAGGANCTQANVTNITRANYTAIEPFSNEIYRQRIQRGVGVVSARYGANCGAGVDARSSVDGVCRGRKTCDYVVNVNSLGDPAFGCAKDFRVSWSCSGGFANRSLTVPAEAGLGSVARLACTGITVVRATYGLNTIPTGPGTPSPALSPINGNASRFVAQACDGKASCVFPISTAQLGDPAVGVAKTFQVEYTCDDEVATRAISVGAEANGSSVTLSCN